MTRIINVGIIGCGEATQLLHLPTLRELGDQFRVVALCDLSESVLQTLGRAFPGAKLHHTARHLIDDPDVDAVLITTPNPYHAQDALEAIRSGKHVLIEKPMCVTLREAQDLHAAEQQYGVTVQIGYMRRYAPAFLEAARLIAAQRQSIRFARVHTIIGPNSAFTDSTTRAIRGTDIPESVMNDTQQRQAELYRQAIGTDVNPKARTYTILLSLSTHDTSAMRELFGMPKEVLYAAQRSGGRCVSAAFDYGDFICHFETNIDQIARFDSYLEVFTDTQVIRVEFDTPYIRHLPVRLSVTEANGAAGVAITNSFPTRNDAFVAEWRAFHHHIVSKTHPKCSIEDATQDLELFRQILQKIV